MGNKAKYWESLVIVLHGWPRLAHMFLVLVYGLQIVGVWYGRLTIKVGPLVRSLEAFSASQLLLSRSAFCEIRIFITIPVTECRCLSELEFSSLPLNPLI